MRRYGVLDDLVRQILLAQIWPIVLVPFGVLAIWANRAISSSGIAFTLLVNALMRTGIGLMGTKARAGGKTGHPAGAAHRKIGRTKRFVGTS